MKKNFLNAGVFSIVIIGGIVGSFLYKNLSERPNFSEVDVKKGDIDQVLNLNGKVKSENVADLGFELGGKITKLVYKVGDSVKRDEIMAAVNNEDVAADYEKNLALLKSAKANLEYYQELLGKEKDELRSLKEEDANKYDKDAQRNQIEASEAQVKAQEAGVTAAQASVQNAQAQIAKKIIRAPFSGTLAKQDAEVGETVANNTPILTLIDENNFKIEVFVSEIDAENIKVGNRAEVTLDNNAEKKYSMRVTSVDPSETLQNNVSAYKVTLNFDESDANVKSGLDANVKIFLATKSDVVIVPEDAIYSENGQNFVYVSVSGIREKREVRVGARGENGMAEILNGLKEGDKIFELTN